MVSISIDPAVRAFHEAIINSTRGHCRSADTLYMIMHIEVAMQNGFPSAEIRFGLCGWGMPLDAGSGIAVFWLRSSQACRTYGRHSAQHPSRPDERGPHRAWQDRPAGSHPRDWIDLGGGTMPPHVLSAGLARGGAAQ